MIAEVIKFLRDRLNQALPRDSSGGAVEDLFVFVGSSKEDAVSFKPDAVSLLLMRIEQDAALRPADLHSRISAAGPGRLSARLSTRTPRRGCTVFCLPGARGRSDFMGCCCERGCVTTI